MVHRCLGMHVKIREQLVGCGSAIARRQSWSTEELGSLVLEGWEYCMWTTRDHKWTDCLLKWKGREKEGKRSNEEVLQWEQDLSKPISQISRLLVTLFLRSQFSWEKRSLLDFYHGMTLVTMEFGRSSLEGDSPTLAVLPEIGCPSFGLGIHSGSQFSPSTMWVLLKLISSDLAANIFTHWTISPAFKRF